MEQALAVMWWVSVATGAVALLVAALSARMRRTALAVAAGGFAVAGVLGIMSVGLVFVILAVACGVAAARTSRETA